MKQKLIIISIFILLITSFFLSASSTSFNQKNLLAEETTEEIPDDNSNYIFEIRTTHSPYTTTTYPTFNPIVLDDLSVDGYNINFIKTLYNYSIVVPSEINSIKVNYELGNNNYVEISGNDNLQSGANKVAVKVYNYGGNFKTYIINVYRGSYVLNNDASLKDIKIANYSLNYDASKYDYDLTIRNDDKLDIMPIPNEPTTNYVINGNDNLKNNSLITIKTIAQDDTVLNYNIRVHYAISILNPLLIYIPLSVIFILSISYFIIDKYGKV